MADYTNASYYTGQRFGNYQLHQFLGVRKNARIFLGEHIHLKTQATVKVYQTRLLQNDQSGFLAEARILARLVHQHIVRVLEFGVEDDTPFLITTYAPEGTLRQHHLTDPQLPLPLVIAYTRQIAETLDYAHSQGVLHLDLKPENMWLRRNHELLLSDFRITFFSSSSRSESIEEIAEAAAYMAPEQIRGQPGPASDQYTLGVVVYEWLCGTRPFLGRNYIEVAQEHLQTLPPALTGRNSQIPLAVEQVVMCALAKDPDQRFSSLQAFASALEQASHATREKPLLLIPPDSLPPGPLSALERPRKRLSRRAVTLGLASFAAAAVAGGAITWFTRSTPQKKAAQIGKPADPGTTFYTYRGHTDTVYGVAWAQDGKSIASWGRDDTMQVWQTSTFARLQIYAMTNILSWSPDWRLMASGNVSGFQVWEVASGRMLFTYYFPYTGAGGPASLPVDAFVQWGPDGNYLASNYGSILTVWNVRTGKALFSYPSSVASWSPDGKRIALQEVDNMGTMTSFNVRILAIVSENQMTTYSIGDSGINWSPDGQYLVSGNGSIWSATTGKLIAKYKGNLPQQANPPKQSFTWSPNSRYVASFDGSQFASQTEIESLGMTADPTVHIWSAATGKELFVYRAHTAGINCIAWSPDSTKIASASADKTVKVWQAIVVE